MKNKVKIFQNADSDKLEKEVNKWLEEQSKNSKFKVTDRNHCSRYEYIVIAIYYEI